MTAGPPLATPQAMKTSVAEGFAAAAAEAYDTSGTEFLSCSAFSGQVICG